ncbi:hypothetical protein AAU57_14685 [Nonlabens sp. YIK11]|uniref:hypothetical protein n=1 Tax=Nonlabens sp. YIK11 TaxID=1453349 RepID=UPI0006DC407A|nr:hypothetical protein [Nonlabens sp. YIK11]KQC31857.1 hypothetical protein AAU57_14685 [Nonlabens sp. YIK11]
MGELVRLSVDGNERLAIFQDDAFITADAIVDGSELHRADEDIEQDFYVTELGHLVRFGKGVRFIYVRDLTEEESNRVRNWNDLEE